MEKLFTLFITVWFVFIADKVLIFWLTQKLLHPKTPDKRNKTMDVRAMYISKLFNQLLKNKKLIQLILDCAKARAK